MKQVLLGEKWKKNVETCQFYERPSAFSEDHDIDRKIEEISLTLSNSQLQVGSKLLSETFTEETKSVDMENYDSEYIEIPITEFWHSWVITTPT